MAGHYFYDPRPFYGQNAHTGLMPMEELFYGGRSEPVPYWMDQRMAPGVVPMYDDFYYPGGYKQMVRRPEIMHQQYVPQRGENNFLPYRRPELVRDDSHMDMYRRSPYNFNNYGRGDGVAVAPGEVMRGQPPLVPLRAQDDTWVHTMSAPAPLGHGHPQGFRGLPEPPPGAMMRSAAPFGNDQFRSGNDQYRQPELPMNNHSNNHSNLNHSNGGGHGTKQQSMGASGNGSFNSQPGHQNAGSYGSQGQQNGSYNLQPGQQNGSYGTSQGQQNGSYSTSQGQQNAGSFVNSQSKSLGQGGSTGGGGAKSGAIQQSSKQNNNHNSNSNGNSNSNQHSNAKRYNNDDSSSDSDDDDDYRNNGAMVKKHGHSSSSGKTSSGHGHKVDSHGHSHGGFDSNSRGVMTSSKKSSSHGSHGGSKHSSGGNKHSSGPGSKISKLLGFQSDSSSSDDDDSYNSHSKSKGSSKGASHGTHVASYQAPNYGSQPKQMQFSSQSKSVELQVPICCDNCERKVRTCLEKMDGVESVLCDQWNRKVIVYGNVKAENVLKRVRRVKKFSELWQNAKQHHFQNQQHQLQQLQQLRLY